MAIGSIIKKQRELIQMTQKELAKGICSEKYIYLIEKGERNPSAFVIKDLNERLGINLFDYYSYSEYENNDLIIKHRKNFDYYTENSNIPLLKKESLEASKLKEFQEEPLVYDIKMINLSYKITIEGKVEEGIKEIKEILSKEDLLIGNIALINLYVILSTAYQLKGKWEKAEETIKKAYRLIENKKKFQRYNTTVISVFISYAAVFFNQADYDSLIEIAHELKKLHDKYSMYNRVYYVNFYLAYAYYDKQDFKKARESYMDGVHSALLFKSVIDLKHILNFDGMKELTKKLEVDDRYLKQMQEIVDKEKEEQ